MIIHTSQDFGTAIRSRRKELGYTQATLASFCGCSTVFLSALEHGKQTVELERALRIANTLGLNVSLEPREAR